MVLPFRHGALRALAVVVSLGGAPRQALAADAPHEPVYVVRQGETVSRVAKDHQVSEHALRLLNGLAKSERIRPGQKLELPAPDGEERSSAATSTSGHDSGGARAAVSRGRGVVRLVRGTETLEIKVLDRRGRVSPTAASQFEHALRFPTGATHKIDPRLVALLGRVSEHFEGRDLVVVSGFRPYSPSQFTAHSNHNIGRAMDFMVRGVASEKVRDFCRTLHNVGVGYYPNSSFIHLDVRSENAYWIDYAGPGQRPRYRRGEGTEGADEGAGEVPLEVMHQARLGPGDIVPNQHTSSDMGSFGTQDAHSSTSRNSNGKSDTSDSTGETSVFPGGS